MTHGGLSSWSNLVLPAGLDVRLQARWTRDAQSNGHSQANGHAKINGQLRRSEQEALEALENLGKVAEKAQELPDPILDRIQHWQDQLDRARADQEYLDQQEQLVAVPTRAQLEQGIEQLASQLKEMKGTVRAELKALVTKIEAVPYRQFGSNKIVLRARFELNLAGLLPPQLRAAIACLSNGPIDKRFGMIPMLVDLFDPSTGPKYGLAG